MRSISYPLAVGRGITRIIEAGTGPAVLLAHGLGARCDRWRTTVERLADQGLRTITYDLPGHGFASKEVDGPGTVPQMAAHALAVMDALGVESAIMAGTSLGAHIVGYAACLDPARVKGLVLVGALGVVPIDPRVAETISRNIRVTRRDEFAGKLRFVMHDPALIDDALVEEEWRMNTAPGALEVFCRMGDYLTGGIADDYVADKLGALFPPEKLLLIWGGEDKAVPLSVGEDCRRALGGPELTVIPGSNHCPYLECPAEFDAALLPFLARCFV